MGEETKSQFKNVAIVGWASSSRDLAPFKDETWEIWGCNGLGRQMVGRWNSWFELHDRVEMEPRMGADYITWLRSREVPVYMWAHHDDIPTSTAYPKEQIFQRFGRYFTSTIAYMLALAIHRSKAFVDGGYEKIGVYGVDMALDSEYQYQRPCCEYLIGLARGLGLEVIVPTECMLLKTPYVYGLEQPPKDHHDNIITEEFLQKRMAELKSKFNDTLKNTHQMEGAMIQMDYFLHLIHTAKREVGTGKEAANVEAAA